MDGDDISECTGRVQTEPLRTTHVDRCAESGPNVELCDTDGTDDYDDSSEADNKQLGLESIRQYCDIDRKS